MKYKYYKVSKAGCVPATFAISKDSVFVYSRALGGAFRHPDAPDVIYKHFKSDPDFVVTKTNSSIFDNVKNWWSVSEMIEYLSGGVA